MLSSLNSLSSFFFFIVFLFLLLFFIFLYFFVFFYFFFSSRRRHTRCLSDWSSDVCSSDLLCRGVGAVGGRQAARRRQGCRINGFAQPSHVCQAAIVGALYVDVERGQVMVRDINRGCIARGVVPHAVVSGNQRGNDIGRGEKRVAAVSGVCRGEPGRERQACQREIGNRGVVGIRQVDGDIRIAATGS